MKPERPSSAGFQPLLPLGSGGMGTAWLCRALGAGEFERLVVVKRPHAHVVEREDAMLRFTDEARLTGSLHHANVVGTHQVGEDEIGPFIVLEYIEGASLDELVERCTTLGEKVPVQVALRIALDALSGLEAAHTAHDHAGRPLNILHRDISLQNLLVGVDGVCRVADFGAAKSDVRKYSTDQRYLLGKLLYLPPEYLRRDETGPTLDIYSLGITLWQTLAGVELWKDQSEAQVVASIIEGKIPKVSEYANVPAELDALIAKATATDLKQRFQSAQLMAEAIESLGRDLGLLAPHSEVARWAKRLIADELQARRQR
ncbi:MAG TPA: serine/threonine-protein kinase, partial [Polyangiaceae bacterium]